MKYVRFSFLFLLLSSFQLSAKEMGHTGYVLSHMQHVDKEVYHTKVENRLKRLKLKEKDSLIQSIVNYRGGDLVQKEKHDELVEYRVFQELSGEYKDKDARNFLTTVYETPLTYAAFMTRTSLFGLLLEYGANYNGANSLGQTPLMVAASVGAVDIVSALLKKKVNPNGKSAYSDRTALHYALRGTLNNHKHSIAVDLINAGTNLTIEDRDFKTPMSEAIRLCNDELVSLMMRKDLPNRYDVNYRTNSEKIVDTYTYDRHRKKSTTSQSPKSNLAQTALMEALDLLKDERNQLTSKQKKNLKKITLMFAKAKDLNLDATDSEGKTALMYAALANDLDVVKTLIERGADDKKVISEENTQDVHSLAKASSNAAVNKHLEEIKKAKESGTWFKKEDLNEDDE